MLESSPATGVQPTLCLNLGCGGRFHADWTNVDIVCGGEGVIVHDLAKSLTFEANTFDVVYHSHVLEHFPADRALKFLRECYRVVRSGGVMRVAVPDLERIARLYLESLDAAISNDTSAQDRHQWMMLEIYDQAVREASGGNMARYLRNPPPAMRDFAVQRLGIEASRLLGPLDKDPTAQTQPPLVLSRHATPAEITPRKSILRRIAGTIRYPHRLREIIIRGVLGSEYELLKLGRFRRGGEIHQWMYDRHSLGRLLNDAGFRNAAVFGPVESKISGWSKFNLDTEADGTTYKPDSLFMEAVKP
ncbi:MAG TPA: methyltransferase domain-containing protein [Humisphaera sp.]|nr:methyltransferase domain-containing protein [Humisphaera sp.]